jgi:S1-C subfamily serine protease
MAVGWTLGLQAWLEHESSAAPEIARKQRHPLFAKTEVTRSMMSPSSTTPRRSYARRFLGARALVPALTTILVVNAFAENLRSAEPPPEAAPAPHSPSSAAAPGVAPPHEGTWLNRVYEQVAESVVLIQTDLANGSGFFFYSKRHVATALHVVDNADEVVVRASDGRRFAARVVAYTREHDLAILELEREVPNARLLTAYAGPIAVGDTVAVVGHPFSGLERKLPQLRGLLNWSLTAGIVGAVAGSWLQTDAAINPGNSGGPAVTPDGGLLGVVDAKVEGAEGLGLVVRANRLNELALRIGKDDPPRRAVTFDGLELGFVVHTGKETVDGFSLGAGLRLYKRFPALLRLGFLSGSVAPDARTTLATRLERFSSELAFGYALALGAGIELVPNLGLALSYDRRYDASLQVDATCTAIPCVVQGEVLRSTRAKLRGLPMGGASIDVPPFRVGYAFQLDAYAVNDSQHRFLGALAF